MRTHIIIAIEAGLIAFIFKIGFLDWEFYGLIISFSFINAYFIKKYKL